MFDVITILYFVEPNTPWAQYSFLENCYDNWLNKTRKKTAYLVVN